MKRNVILTFVLATAVSAIPALAASLTIGVATAVATFSMDNSTVSGSADVVNGAVLRTTLAPSDVHLQSGVDFRLATRSAGTVYGDHAVLKQGAVRVANFDKYSVQVDQYQVQADSPATEAIVRVTGKTIEVASIGGTLRVTDGGAMLTRVAAGTRMSFQNSGQGQTPANPGQTGAAPAQTGAAPAEKGPFPEKKVVLWSAGICAVGAIVVGSIAAAQGKSPF